ncbi:hypothetical protein [Photobacterium sp. R1]
MKSAAHFGRVPDCRTIESRPLRQYTKPDAKASGFLYLAFAEKRCALWSRAGLPDHRVPPAPPIHET